MRWLLVALASLMPVRAGGQLLLDHPVPVSSSREVFQYDDGTAYWLTWQGLYRGVWFDWWDFEPGGPGASINNLEYWFYHHSGYPWDTASFYSELYTGSAEGPVTQIDQTSLTALHYQPVYAVYDSPIDVGRMFWALQNSEMSTGGWPSLLGDGSENPVDHSFYSDDFIVWTPWVPESAGLESRTWGSVKTAFSTAPMLTPGCADYLIRFECTFGGSPLR
jgi:hypothetical protein